jgi:transcriptional regulator with XRE-family HTH domain
MRKKLTKEELDANSRLTDYGLRKALTIPTTSIIQRINEGYTQSQIAREFGTSKSAVSQRVKRLVARKLLTLTPGAGGSKRSSFDVHLGSIKYPLTKDVNLPFDLERKLETLTYREWTVKAHRIRINLGINGEKSLEIFGTRYESNLTIDEAQHRQEDDIRGLYSWLCQKYPELAKASNEHNYKTNRPGKLTIHALKGTAEQILKSRGGGQVILDNVGMIDDSLKDGGEFHIFLSFMKNLANKEDIGKLAYEMQETRKSIMELLTLIKGKPPPEPENPSGPPGDIYG